MINILTKFGTDFKKYWLLFTSILLIRQLSMFPVSVSVIIVNISEEANSTVIAEN